MSEHVESALFVFSESGKSYYDELIDNKHGTAVSPVTIEELRENSAALLKDSAHLVVAAELPIIKEVLKLAIGCGASVGFLPLDSQKALQRCYGIPGDKGEMISLALKADPAEIDIVFCNDHILLFKGIVGWAPLIDSRKTASRFEIVGDALKKMKSLHLFPFSISTLGSKKNKIATAACGCIILENPDPSYTSRVIADDCSFEDAMISAVVIAPFSIIDYLKLLWQRLFSNIEPSRMPPSLGYIKTSELLIKPTPALDVIIDGEKLTTTPAHFRVQPAAVKINHGFTGGQEKIKKTSGKEKFAVSLLPAGKEVEKARSKRVPFFTYASEERFKDLFVALREDARLNSIYLVLMVLSTTLATVGLYLNSASVIIGAMLLAPLMAPIISLAMSVLRYDQKLFKQSFTKICVGVAVALAVAIILTWLSPYQPVTGEMRGRLSPSTLDLIVAVVAGIAGAYTKSFKEILQSLAGVAIAVALVPPLAVAGIGLGRFDLVFFGNAFLLFITNFIGIVLAATFTFRLLGYSPVVKGRRALYITLAFLLLIFIPLSLSFRGITWRTEFEQSWKHERFLVNGKYLIVNQAEITTFHDRKILVVDIHAREPLDRQDLNEFKRKVQRNFPERLIIRARITYIP